MSRHSERSHLWLPQHWPSWFGLALFRALTRLPWSCRQRLAEATGWFVYTFIPIRRRVVLINLRLCFPEKSEQEIHALARAHYRALAFGLFETCSAWWTPADQLPAFSIRGREHLEAALARGKGVVLLTGHFTTLEICARMMAVTVRFACLYRDPNNPVIASVMRQGREKQASLAIHFDEIGRAHV